MKSITLVAIDGIGTETTKYQEICEKIIKKFGFLNINEVLFITANKNYFNSNFNVIYTDRLYYLDLNVLLFQKLINFSNGEYFMTIQTDGYPLNDNLWDDQFLNYDYIGAPWPKGMGWTPDAPLVGNGGFSIRSRKLYEITKNITGYADYFRTYGVNEDVMLSFKLRSFLEENKINFAPVDIASRFSVEIPLSDDHNINTAFGFHGKNHLEKLIENNDKRML